MMPQFATKLSIEVSPISLFYLSGGILPRSTSLTWKNLITSHEGRSAETGCVEVDDRIKAKQMDFWLMWLMRTNRLWCVVEESSSKQQERLHTKEGRQNASTEAKGMSEHRH
jgi:hypothetical protein